MLAQTSPKGWNSWNTFGENISEQLLMEVADAMVSTGLRDAGYEYVVIDDCWSLRERVDGKIVADPKKFPHGMKYLADYIHSKGLKFGMYSCAGVMTCAGYPGSFDHEFEDAKMFAEFGVDFLKYDFCNKPKNSPGPFLYNRMGMALKASGREILFSACNWGEDNVHQWIRSTGAHMYRSTGDINDSFNSFRDIFASQYDKFCYSAPGCWNDMDMLTVGMHGKGNVALGGCTDEEYRTQFALFCLYQTPLMIGCDIRNVDETNLALLKNPELLRLHDDPEARPPFVVNHFSGWNWYETNPEKNFGRITFFKHMADGEYALALANFTDNDGACSINLFDIGLSVGRGYGLSLTDIDSGVTLPTVAEHFAPVVPSHGIKIYRAKVVQL